MRGASSVPSVENARPYGEWVWAAAFTSGRAAWIWLWMAKAAVFTGQSPSTTLPSWSHRMRSRARIMPKLMPNGFTQNSSGCSGSRPVRWPATPSLNPNLSNRRKAAAIRCFMWVRCSSGDENVGNRWGLRSDMGRSDPRLGPL